MRFNDGHWRTRRGFRLSHPLRAYDVATADGRLTVLAPTRPIEHPGRAHSIGGPLLTIEWTAPMPDVIGVTITHFAGDAPRTPSFELRRDPGHRPDVVVDDDAATLSSGALSARILRGDEWLVEYLAGGRLLTSSRAKAMAVVDADGGERYLREQLSLGVGGLVYGLGERFGPFVKNGQSVDMWNADGGTSSELAYKNVPFYLTNEGYGVFVDHPGRVSFEVATEVVTRVGFSTRGESLAYVLIFGPTPKEILEKYTALTGRPALPPPWSFGLWLTTSFTTSYDEATVTRFVEGMAERDLPLSVFHFDSFWMREFHLVDFTWDARIFPDPEAMLRRLKDRGLRVSVWINPYVGQASALFDEGRRNGYLLKRADGGVWQTDDWQPGMGLVDFTNPAARTWFRDKLAALLDMGVDCFKSDFGERVPTDDVAWWDGSDPERMHNFYTSLYNETVFELLVERRGVGEAVVFARSATAGTQRFPVHWGGDNSASYPSMAETLRGGLSLALSGFGFWSHDIGGFEGTPTSSLFKRWVPFGMLSSHSRLHGSHSYRVPWLFDEPAVDVLRCFAELKHRLMPYLYGCAVEAHERGIPVMRPMALEFPDDPACGYLDRQYMLGPSLLVAPVFSDDGDVEYYIPAGRWTRLSNGEVVEGPRWCRERHDFMSLPLLVRPGSIVPFGRESRRPDYDFRDDVTLRAYEIPDGARIVTSVPGPPGDGAARFELRRDGGTIVVTPPDDAAPWRVLLAGLHVEGIDGVEGGSAEASPQGVEVSPRDPTSELRVELSRT